MEFMSGKIPRKDILILFTGIDMPHNSADHDGRSARSFTIHILTARQLGNSNTNVMEACQCLSHVPLVIRCSKKSTRTKIRRQELPPRVDLDIFGF